MFSQIFFRSILYSSTRATNFATTQCIKRLSAYAGTFTNHVAPVINNYQLAFSRLYSEHIKPDTMDVDYDYVNQASKDSNILIVDVREPDEIREHGNIPNSINIPLGNVTSILSTMAEEEFKKTYQRMKPSGSTEIIFYCMIGKRSGKAQQNAINLGFKNTKNYVGSWTDWKIKNENK